MSQAMEPEKIDNLEEDQPDYCEYYDDNETEYEEVDIHTAPPPIPEEGDADLPPDHALPAAYMMWKDLSKKMNERASQWEEQEFRFRMERAAIIYEIQMQRIQKTLLEAALDEMHRHQELLEFERMLQKQLVP